MSDANKLIKAVGEAVELFKAGSYEQLQKFLGNVKLKEAIQAETDGKLQGAVNNLFDHMSIATNPKVNGRLGDEVKKRLSDSINRFENHQSSNIPISTLINGVGNGFHRAVEHISSSMQQQATALTTHEKEIFDKGNYWWELTKSRWSGTHYDGAEVTIKVAAPPSPPPQFLSSLGGLLGANENNIPQNIAPNNVTIDKTIKLEGKALEEFGKVKLLDDAWDKAGAIAAGLAGVGIVAHGVRNIYLSIKPDANEKLEVADLSHEKPHDGEINWLRMVVGAGEIGVGSAIIIRQATGRQFWELNNPVVGSFTALCNHGDAAIISNGGI